MHSTDPRLVDEIHRALPQTQCTRCNYPDCRGYAQAIAEGQAAINQCPPGGAEGVARLAVLTGQPVQALNPAHGMEAPRAVAVIDENWCIGCTLCQPVCPTDAIVGGNKLMHTVIEPYCTGCQLCLPVCPVDCIEMQAVTETTGWAAWSEQQAQQSLQRYQAHQGRIERTRREDSERSRALAQHKLKDLAAHSQITDAVELERKRAVIEQAMSLARKRRGSDPGA